MRSTKLLSLFLLAVLAVARPAQAAVFTVTNTNSTGAGSLRAAIASANANPDLDTIGFNIPEADPGRDAASGVFTIDISEPLPSILSPVNLNGSTQPGFAGSPIISLNGAGAGAGAAGLQLRSTGSTVRDVAIFGFTAEGISISGPGAASNRVAGCIIGLDPRGNINVGNEGAGIRIENSGNNTIGGEVPSDRNVIAGNLDNGIQLQGAESTGNRIIGNFIGLNSAGDAAAGNSDSGIYLLDSSGNFIGGSGPGEGNVISGNGENGIEIEGNSNVNSIVGNLIGTSASGAAELGNGQSGILIRSGRSTTIGGPGNLDRNVISGNTTDGITIRGIGSPQSNIQNNLVGVARDGFTPMGNGSHGINVNEAPSTRIGTNTAGSGNTIAANARAGIFVTGVGASVDGPTEILGNFIGTSEVLGDDGRPRNLGNATHGVVVENTQSVRIGRGNQIRFNTQNGVDVSGSSSGVTIEETSFSSNGGLALDLNADGVTPNDTGDADAGPNSLLNAPYLEAVFFDATEIRFSGFSPDGANLEFFISDGDASGFGEGFIRLGALVEGSAGDSNTTIGTYDDLLAGSDSAPRFQTIIPNSEGLTASDTVTAIATDSSGNTSEFSLSVVAHDLDDDFDNDELSNREEIDLGTNYRDNDSDDDGIFDGREVLGDNSTDPLDPDSDDDLLCDGSLSVAAVCTGGEDQDNDGVLDSTETDPNNSDTDAGGVQDGREVLTDLTDPLNRGDDVGQDPDGDGLLNEREATENTNPLDPDSDDDGINDGFEVLGQNQSNPLDPDSDDDRLCDGNIDFAGICDAGEDVNVDGDRDPLETNPTDADTDDGGVQDGTEVLTQSTNPLDPSDDFPPNDDLDDDGLTNEEEDDIGTNPRDGDSDDDGLLDGLEVHGQNPTDPLDPDTDGDLLCDGPLDVTEECVGGEDANANGALDEAETDPADADTDDDCLLDGEELAIETDPLDPDTDDDLVFDGTETGFETANLNEDTDLDAGFCIADADPDTTTEPTDPDTDGGGATDGAEDSNGDGNIDDGETDPNDPSDDNQVKDTGGLHVRGGRFFGCAMSNEKQAPAGLVLMLLGAILWRRRRHHSSAVSDGFSTATGLGAAVIAALVVSFSLPRTSVAQSGFDVQQFRPMPGQHHNYLNVSGARFGEALSWDAGIMFDYAKNPLVVENDSGDRKGKIVADQLTLHLMGSFAPTRFLDIGLVVPMILVQHGDGTIAGSEDPGFGMGDIRLLPRVRILGGEGKLFGLAALVAVQLPSGVQREFQGGDLRVEPRLIAEFSFTEKARLAANLGYVVRPKSNALDLEVNDTLEFGVGADLQFGEMFHLVPELRGGVSVLAKELKSQEIPLELLAAGRIYLQQGLMFQAGLGTGLVKGFGSPDYRIFAGVHYRPAAPVRVEDSDRDGIADDRDQCPDVKEDVDSFEDEDGCPDPDNDADQILDVDDECPLQPEDFDGFQDENGCPDPDNDGDGILDIVDGAPNDPEDFDQFEDHDGIPDIDNDQDSILDVDDRCPINPEVFNGVTDTDGCPDEGGLVQVTCEAVELGESVFFDTDKDIIQTRSYNLLNQVAEALGAAQHIRLVRVEGHTDSDGTDDYNEDLSNRRAAAVRQYLIDHGVEQRRVESIGYGESRPIADNATDAGKAQNRRVEIVIVEQTRCVGGEAAQ